MLKRSSTPVVTTTHMRKPPPSLLLNKTALLPLDVPPSTSLFAVFHLNKGSFFSLIYTLSRPVTFLVLQGRRSFDRYVQQLPFQSGDVLLSRVGATVSVPSTRIPASAAYYFIFESMVTTTTTDSDSHSDASSSNSDSHSDASSSNSDFSDTFSVSADDHAVGYANISMRAKVYDVNNASHDVIGSCSEVLCSVFLSLGSQQCVVLSVPDTGDNSTFPVKVSIDGRYSFYFGIFVGVLLGVPLALALLGYMLWYWYKRRSNSPEYIVY